MSATAIPPIPRFGPAPAGFLITSKALDSISSVLERPEVYEQIRALLLMAETELFIPLLTNAKPNEFTQQFEFFANRYFPIRLQALLNLANAVGVDKLRQEYFEQIPQLISSLADRGAQSYGLSPSEVTGAFDQYFLSARRIIAIASKLMLAPAEPLLQLLDSITQVDFGFTGLGLVFEGSLTSSPWAVHELFKLTRRSLLVYRDATDNLISCLGPIQPEQGLIDFDAAYHAAVTDIAHYEGEIDDPPNSDLRDNFRRYNFVKR
jgi:hypothetical protein